MSQNPRLELYIGAFVLAGVLVVGGMILSTQGGGGLFRETYKVIVEIDHIGGLRIGAPVKLGGYEIGSVSDIRLGTQRLEVEVRIDRNRKLTTDTEANIANAGLVGDTFLEFTQGDSGEYLPRNPNAPMSEIPRVPGHGPVNMNALFKRVEEIGVGVDGLVGNLNKIIGDDEVQRNIKESIANVNATALETKRLVVSLRRSTELVQEAVVDVRDTAAKVKSMTDTVKGAVEKTVADPKIVEAINETVANARDVSREAKRVIADVTGLMKTAGSMLDENRPRVSAVMEDLQTASGRAKETLESARLAAERIAKATEGVEPSKVRQTLEELMAALENARVLIQRVREDLPTALSINKAADRIVREKFDEMKRRGVRDADAQLEEIRAWWRWNMETRGRIPDPKYAPGEEPYAENLESIRRSIPDE